MVVIWELKEARLQGEAIRGVVPHVPDTYYLKEVSVGAEGVVVPRPQHSALAGLGPRL